MRGGSQTQSWLREKWDWEWERENEAGPPRSSAEEEDEEATRPELRLFFSFSFSLLLILRRQTQAQHLLRPPSSKKQNQERATNKIYTNTSCIFWRGVWYSPHSILNVLNNLWFFNFYFLKNKLALRKVSGWKVYSIRFGIWMLTLKSMKISTAVLFLVVSSPSYPPSSCSFSSSPNSVRFSTLHSFDFPIWNHFLQLFNRMIMFLHFSRILYWFMSIMLGA